MRTKWKGSVLWVHTADFAIESLGKTNAQIGKMCLEAIKKAVADKRAAKARKVWDALQ